MGSGCCGEDRKIASQKKYGKISLTKGELMTTPIDSQTKTSENSSKEPQIRYTNEDDVSALTDTFISSRENFTLSSVTVLENALTKAKDITSDKALPFMIAPFNIAGSKIGIFSKNYQRLNIGLENSTIDTLAIVKSHVVVNFTSPTMVKNQFLANIQAEFEYFLF